MKTFWKILAAVIAVAGVVFVLATYGDKIVAWAKNLLNRCGCCCCGDDCCCGDECCCEENAVQADEADFEG